MAAIAAEEERMVKMEVDYSEAVVKVIPECEALVEQKKLNEALEKLLVLEKQTRGVSSISNQTLHSLPTDKIL